LDFICIGGLQKFRACGAVILSVILSCGSWISWLNRLRRDIVVELRAGDNKFPEKLCRICRNPVI
jgi:hypothetical protein